jgi:hypothetical protein
MPFPFHCRSQVGITDPFCVKRRVEQTRQTQREAAHSQANEFYQQIYEQAGPLLARIIENSPDSDAISKVNELDGKILGHNLEEKLPRERLQNGIIHCDTIVAHVNSMKPYPPKWLPTEPPPASQTGDQRATAASAGNNVNGSTVNVNVNVNATCQRNESTQRVNATSNRRHFTTDLHCSSFKYFFYFQPSK